MYVYTNSISFLIQYRQLNVNCSDHDGTKNVRQVSFYRSYVISIQNKFFSTHMYWIKNKKTSKLFLFTYTILTLTLICFPHVSSLNGFSQKSEWYFALRCSCEGNLFSHVKRAFVCAGVVCVMCYNPLKNLSLMDLR